MNIIFASIILVAIVVAMLSFPTALDRVLEDEESVTTESDLPENVIPINRLLAA